jgi:uncharacterized protein YbbK (DUF523 family)
VDRSTIPEPSWRGWHNEEPVRLGISSCLLGAKVRYDGGHKHDRYVTDVLGEFFEWVPVCPELEIGLGVPRPPIQLVKNEPTPRLVEPVSSDDLTERMEGFAGRRLAEIEELGLDGFILKSRSPSCGLEGVDVFDADRSSTTDGVGIFARVLAQRWPGLPVAEEAWFGDDRRFRDFIERVLRNHRQRTLSRRGLDPRQLAELDSAHERLLAHISHHLA